MYYNARAKAKDDNNSRPEKPVQLAMCQYSSKNEK
jgi:hypothetical protein